MLNFIATDLQLYKIFKITRVSFLRAQCSTNGKPIRDFLLVFHDNHVPIFYCFEVICWSKICNFGRFYIPQSISSTPGPIGVIHSCSFHIRVDITQLSQLQTDIQRGIKTLYSFASVSYNTTRRLSVCNTKRFRIHVAAYVVHSIRIIVY